MTSVFVEVGDELADEIGESEERCDVIYALWLWPSSHCLRLFGVDSADSVSDSETKHLDLLLSPTTPS